MEYLIIFFSFLTVLMASLLVQLVLNREGVIIGQRISSILITEELTPDSEEENRPFVERVLQPVYNGVIDAYLSLTPRSKMDQLTKQLEMAGLLKNIGAPAWVFRRTLATIIVVAAYLATALRGNQELWRTVFVVAFLGILVHFGFHFYLKSAITARQNRMLKSMPFTLDLLTLGVEAGLSFSDSIVSIVENYEGDLADEFSKTLKEIRMGIDKKQALKNMIRRVELKELSEFLNSLIQAEELGVGIAKVMRIESVAIRNYLKERSREKAMQAPVKMLFPLIFLIFPSIFVIILGPALIKLIGFFSGGIGGGGGLGF